MLASVRLLRNITGALAVLGYDPGVLLREAKLTPEDLEHVDGDEEPRVPVDVLRRLWTAAVAVTGDPGIGVRVGALARLEHFGILGNVARASATLGDALLKTGRYMNLLMENARLSLLVEGDLAQVVYKTLRPISAPAADAVLAQLSALSRELTGVHIVPAEVSFVHASPGDDSSYREVFGVAPRFDDFQNALVVPAEVLTLPIATHDASRAELLTARATRLVDALPAEGSLSVRVRDVLARELRAGNPIVENVAAQLDMQPKALTRLLKREGTSHSELLDAVRRELAERYLAAPELNVTEVAFLLGFSDASAFNKAVRRWFGMAPLAFRRQHS